MRSRERRFAKQMEPRFFQKDIETMKRADIEALQLRRLKWIDRKSVV